MTQGKVISLEMTVLELGDRGSKSDGVCKRATSRRFFNVVFLSGFPLAGLGLPSIKYDHYRSIWKVFGLALR